MDSSYNVRSMMSKYGNDSLVILESKRQAGYSYKFQQVGRQKQYYRCTHCFELGKTRCITIVDGHVGGRKNPEDDHHAYLVMGTD